MPENAERLRNTLKELHEQLASTDTVDAEVRALLEGAMDEIHAHLEDSESPKDEREVRHAALTDRMKETVQQFEASHPTLAGVMERIINILGQMGI